jgi:hypothetical protein
MDICCCCHHLLEKDFFLRTYQPHDRSNAPKILIEDALEDRDVRAFFKGRTAAAAPFLMTFLRDLATNFGSDKDGRSLLLSSLSRKRKKNHELINLMIEATHQKY